MPRGRVIDVVEDRTEDLPPSKQRCDRCGASSTTLWAMRFSATQIALCGEHLLEHLPNMLEHEWFRIECHSQINPISKPKRRARLVK